MGVSDRLTLFRFCQADAVVFLVDGTASTADTDDVDEAADARM